MIPNSILLVRTFAMMALFFTSFSPMADSPITRRLNISPSSQIVSPRLEVVVQPAKAVNFAPNEQPTGDTIIYLPIVLKSFYSFSGTVTDNGIPVADQTVDLRFYDGLAWTTFDTQVTNPAGSYYFTNLPILTAGQEYYVRWLNDLDNHNYLSAYYCDTIDPDNIGYSPMVCDFNIHNVFHVSPDNDASVQLPKRFEWTLRSSTSDSYEFNVSDTVTDTPWWWTNPPLGYTNTYQLTSLPAGFQTNVPYGWFIGVYGVNGMGFSFFYRTVTFQNSGNVLIGPDVPIDNQAWGKRKEREMIFPLKVSH